AAEQGQRLPLRTVVSWRPFYRGATALLFAGAIFALYPILLPHHFGNAAVRFMRPTSSALPLTRVNLTIEPGDALVARGSSVLIKAAPVGSLPDQGLKATVSFRQPDQTASFDMVFDGSIFIHSISDIQQTLKYRVRAGDFRSPWFNLRVADKPEITRFRITYRYPPYTRLPEQVVRATQGHIRAVVGTRVMVEASANRPVSKALVSDEHEQPMASTLELAVSSSEGSGQTSRVRFDLSVEREQSYRVVVHDQQGLSNEPAPLYTIKVTPDLPPTIAIQKPRDSIDVPQGRDLPVLYVASDDYGISSLKATLAHPDGTARQTVEDRAFTTPTLRIGDGFRLSLKDHKAGDELVLQMMARDTNPLIAGMAMSDPVRIRIIDPAKVAASELEKFDALDGKALEKAAGDSQTTKSLAAVTDQRLTTGTNLTEQLKQLRDKIDEFQDVQRRVIQTTEDLGKVPPDKFTDQQLGELKDVANSEDEWAKFFKEAATDLSRLPQTRAVDTALTSEVLELYSEIKKVADNLQPKNVEIYVPIEQMGLELSEKIENRIEEWLMDVGDFVKWELEEPEKAPDVPLAELPDELTDLMGDLIEQEENMTDAIEDVSSSWADSMSDAGWDTMDGPISNFSAVGKTGNVLPNDIEISGRSGEGRTGKSHGEFVEKTAVGKGGRNTPTRLTPEAFEETVVQDKSKEGRGGSTGGGKRAGFGGRGLTGPTPPITQDQGIRLAGQQADIREKAQKLEQLLRRYQLPNAKLHDAIEQMRLFEQAARSGRYDALLAIQKTKIADLREGESFVREKIRLNREKNDSIPPSVRYQITQGLHEGFPDGYEDLLKTYYELLAK
ncbi:DUF4175 family protein, partial [Candidatus Sumerlaeota bacterium]|nr:DUF4175 family protein [Candidatus Sumerlaeota bacterium]